MNLELTFGRELSQSLILSDKNIVTGRHLGNKEAAAFQVA